MNDRSPNVLTKTLAFCVVLEVATGLALMVNPALVVRLLLGAEISDAGLLLGRCFGIALFGLSLACWPDRQRSEPDTAAFRGMLIYNALIASYLGYLGTVGHADGLLLWPAVAVHAVVAILLIRSMRIEPPAAEIEE